jgi:type II secretory pathway pseudopilin PulG
MTLLDVKALTGSLIVLAVSVGVAATLWTVSSGQETKIQLEKDRVEFALNAARARLLKTGSERHVIEDNLAEWQSLERRGFTNGNQRLAWLEAVTNANRNNQLYGLEYTLAAPIPASAASHGGLPLMQTTIHIKMPILTEDDLVHFLNSVKSHPAGLMRPKSCTITRTGPLPPALVNQPGLDAECDLLWYTLKTSL